MEMPHVDANAPSIRALIANDDDATRQRLRALAAAVPDMIVIGECATGHEAVAAMRASPVDLIFLAVEMAGLDGFSVIAEIGTARMPTLVFTSPSSAFAARAFESFALDYLLSPFGDARFFAAVARARQQIEMRRVQGAIANAEGDSRRLSVSHSHQQPERATYHDAIAIRTGSQYEVVRVPDIDWIEANGNYSKLYLHQRSRILTKTLATLEKEVLDPAVFIRVHRSAIVNSAKITAVEPHFHGELTLVLQNGAQVQCSRRFRHFLERRVYFTT